MTDHVQLKKLQTILCVLIVRTDHVTIGCHVYEADEGKHFELFGQDEKCKSLWRLALIIIF